MLPSAQETWKKLKNVLLLNQLILIIFKSLFSLLQKIAKYKCLYVSMKVVEPGFPTVLYTKELYSSLLVAQNNVFSIETYRIYVTVLLK